MFGIGGGGQMSMWSNVQTAGRTKCVCNVYSSAALELNPYGVVIPEFRTRNSSCFERLTLKSMSAKYPSWLQFRWRCSGDDAELSRAWSRQVINLSRLWRLTQGSRRYYLHSLLHWLGPYVHCIHLHALQHRFVVLSNKIFIHLFSFEILIYELNLLHVTLISRILNECILYFSFFQCNCVSWT